MAAGPVFMWRGATKAIARWACRGGQGRQCLVAAIVGATTTLIVLAVGLFWAWVAAGDGFAGLAGLPIVMFVAAAVGLHSGRMTGRMVDRRWRWPKAILATPGLAAVVVLYGVQWVRWGVEPDDTVSVATVYGIVFALPLLLTYLGLRGVTCVVEEEAGIMCRKCEYNLTWNVSGRCPECGEVIAAASEE